MHARTVARTSAGVAFATALAFFVVVLAPNASAQATCTFDETTGAMQITLVGGAPAVLARDTAGIITLDTVPCGTATVSNTETITVTGSGVGQADDFTLDLANGPFAPGLTTEGDGGDPEIEISVNLPGGGAIHVLGGSGDDAITIGTLGVNLNAAEAVGDVDLTVTGTVSLDVDGRDGADALSVAGGAGTGEATSGQRLTGGSGDDLLVSTLGGSSLGGGDGLDTVDYAGTLSVLAILPSGTAQPSGGLPDTLSGIENVTGSPGADRIVGNQEANVLLGGAGDDILDGARGDDTLDGGEGTDTVDYSGGTEPVEVDLKGGTATGQGTDTLSGIENVIGSFRKDTIIGSAASNVLKGLAGSDEIRGQAGSDEVVGGLGNDLLFGGADRDVVDGGPGRDQLDGGDGRDTCIPGKDPDAWTGCERVKL